MSKINFENAKTIGALLSAKDDVVFPAWINGLPQLQGQGYTTRSYSVRLPDDYIEEFVEADIHDGTAEAGKECQLRPLAGIKVREYANGMVVMAFSNYDGCYLIDTNRQNGQVQAYSALGAPIGNPFTARVAVSNTSRYGLDCDYDIRPVPPGRKRLHEFAAYQARIEELYNKNFKLDERDVQEIPALQGKRLVREQTKRIYFTRLEPESGSHIRVPERLYTAEFDDGTILFRSSHDNGRRYLIVKPGTDSELSAEGVLYFDAGALYFDYDHTLLVDIPAEDKAFFYSKNTGTFRDRTGRISDVWNVLNEPEVLTWVPPAKMAQSVPENANVQPNGQNTGVNISVNVLNPHPENLVPPNHGQVGIHSINMQSGH